MAVAISGLTLTQSGTDTTLEVFNTAIIAIPLVARNTAYSVNTVIKPPTANGFLYRCSVAGTTSMLDVVYTPTVGASVVDGTATFVAILASTKQIVGSKTIYRINSFQVAINGILTYDAKLEALELTDCTTSPVFRLNSGANLTINSLINTKATYEEALVIRPASNSIQTELQVNTGATFNLNGGKIVVSGFGSSDYQSIFFNKGATVNITNGWLKSSKNQTRWGEQGSGNMLAMNINGLIAEKIYTTIFGVFGSFNGLAPLNSVTQTVSYGAFPNSTIRDYAPLDSGSFLDNYDIVNLFVVNSLGSGLTYKSGQGPGKWITLRKEFTLKTVTASLAAINGAVLYIKDTNNGGRVNIPAIPNQLNDNVYISSTAGTGITPTISVNVMHAQALSGYQSTPTRDYRTKTSIAGDDLFDVNIWAYGYSFALLNDTAMKGTGVLALSSTLLADTSVTLSETNAIAKLASSFSVAGNFLTVTANSTLDDVYDAMKVYKTRPIQAQLEYPTIATQPVTASGTNLVTAMTIVVNAGVVLSGGTKFKSITSSGVTITGNALSNITINSNVTQNTPTNLTNVTITGTLFYNTATNTDVTFTNSTLATVSNASTGVVTVKRVNSTLTAGTNVVSFVPTTLTFTLNGGRIRVLNNLGVEQYNTTTDGTFELPASATGTWTYRIAKYGSQVIDGNFTIDGTTKTIVPSYIPDTFVIDTLSNVTVYTDLNGTQKIYDYQSYNLTTATGISIGSKLSKGFGTLSVTGALVFDANAVSLFDYTANVLTVKTSAIAEATTIFATGNFTQNTSTISNDVKIRALNFDSEIIYNADSLTFYPTLTDRDAGTNAGVTTTGSVYRYKFGDIYIGVTMTAPLYLRYAIGFTISLATLPIVSGNFVFSLSTNELLLQNSNNLRKVNNNLLKESLLTPIFLKETF